MDSILNSHLGDDYMPDYSDDYMVPPPHDDSWIAGNIEGLQGVFESRICPQSYDFYIHNSHDQRSYADLPLSAKAKVPACWSETHEPAVQFLSEETYLRLFMGESSICLNYTYELIFQVNDVGADRTTAQNQSASGVRPLENTPFDSQEVQELLHAYHDGDAELIPVLHRLTALMGDRYQPIISKLMNHLTKDPEGACILPYTTAIAAAKHAYLAEVGKTSAGPSAPNVDQGQSNYL